jgi:DNA-binding protein YbaB
MKNLVGQHLRQGVRINGANEIEHIHVLEEIVHPDGKRFYKTRVRIGHNAFHRTVDADKYDMMFTPNQLVPNLHRKYKGENPNQLARATK